MMDALVKTRVAAFALLFGAAMNCATFGDLRAQPVRKQVATRGSARAVWTKQRARAWADSTGWLVGSNFIPSTAINQLEMWQATTFDPRTIDRELGWAESLGFNTMRVFLHNLLWQQDSIG
ncbi:MAG TPA: hypothetical protein VNG73_03720, partial [Gemmatimonadaceae bacterium]|nr:hypothetical protein [Gemmatimonadaceae bacterium]